MIVAKTREDHHRLRCDWCHQPHQCLTTQSHRDPTSHISAIRHPPLTGSCNATWKQIGQLKKQKAKKKGSFFLQCQ